MPGWTKVPAGLLDAPISDRAVRLWIVLEQHQRGNGSSWPSRDHLAAHLRCSRWTLASTLAELEEAGWLEVQRNTGGRGKTNRYVVIHNGSSPAPVTQLNGWNPAPLSEERGAGALHERGAPVHPETEVGKQSMGQVAYSTTDHARDRCEHGAVIAGDGSCCPTHEQRPIWPAAVAAGGQA